MNKTLSGIHEFAILTKCGSNCATFQRNTYVPWGTGDKRFSESYTRTFSGGKNGAIDKKMRMKKIQLYKIFWSRCRD